MPEPELSFNLVDERWIPIVLASGEPAEVSLRELFADPAAIRDLHDDSPLVTVSLLRLLLTIVMAAQPWRGAGAPKRKKLWREWWPNKTLPLAQINAYLDEWHGRFDLFDAQHPWMQTPTLTVEGAPDSILRLCFEEWFAGAFSFPENTMWQSVSSALAIRLLLATQSFSKGLGISSDAKIHGKFLPIPDNADAPTLRGVTIWHSGKNLQETLLLNLFPSEHLSLDCPSWEADAAYEWRDRSLAEDTGRIGIKQDKRKRKPVESPKGPMDIFTWQSRLLRLLPGIENSQLVVRDVYFTQGRSLENVMGQVSFFDPMKLYIQSDEGFRKLSLDADKATWRDVHAFLQVARRESGGEHGLAATRWLAESGMVENHQQIKLNVVGLATLPAKDGKQAKAAKFLLWRHDTFNLPMVFLQNEERANRVKLALINAESLGKDLYRKIHDLVYVFFYPNSETNRYEEAKGKMKKEERKKVDKLADAFDPRRAFWPRLEARFERFLRELAASDDLHAPVESWLDDIEGEARRCFRESRAQLGDQFRSYRGAVISDFFQTPARFQQTPKKNSSAPAPASQGTLALEFPTGGDV